MAGGRVLLTAAITHSQPIPTRTNRIAAIELRSPDQRRIRDPPPETDEALFIAMSEGGDPNAANPSGPRDAPCEEEEEEATEAEENEIDLDGLHPDSLVLRGSKDSNEEEEEQAEAAADEQVSEAEEAEIDLDLDLACGGLLPSQPRQDAPGSGAAMDVKRAALGYRDDEEKQEEAPGTIKDEAAAIIDLDDRLIERMESQEPTSSPPLPPGKVRLSQRGVITASLLRRPAGAAAAAAAQNAIPNVVGLRNVNAPNAKRPAAAPGGGAANSAGDDAIDIAENGAIDPDSIDERLVHRVEHQRNDDRSETIDLHLAPARIELAERLTELISRGAQLDETLIREYNEAFRLEGLSSSMASPASLESQRAVRSVPGAFRVVPGRSVERASAMYTSSEDSVHSRNEVSAPSPPALSAQSSDNRTLLVEANLVGEEEDESHSATILVEAKPIRRVRQLAIIAAVVVAIALIVGLSVGLTTKQSSLPTTPPPTPAPTSQLDELFRRNLPQYTVDSLGDASTPQSRAYEWVTEVDDVPRGDAQGDEELLVERMKQRFALATLYYATGGENSWTNKEGWLNATAHECSWSGCCCSTQCSYFGSDDTASNGARELVQLSLPSNGLQQSLPLEIGLLLTLTSLSLRENNLRGSLPSTLDSLTNLLSLDLYSNWLTSLPTTIGRLASLSSLDAGYNSFTGGFPIEICQLSTLVSLSLHCGARAGDGCSSGTGLTGPLPTELGRLSQLTALDLSWNQLSTTPSEIGLLTNLLSLNLEINALAGTIPVEIARLSKLTSLSVSSNLLSSSMPTELGLLIKLEYLRLQSNSLTGPIPTELGQMSGIMSLDLMDNQFNSTIPTHLGRLRKLQSLGIGQYFSDVACELTGPIPTEFAVLSSLTSLVLSSTRLNSTIPTEIGLLVKLEDLTLSNNSLIGPIPSEIGRLSDLSSLDISSNNLRLTIPTELSFLTKLQSIDLSSNALTGAIPTVISKLASLSSLDSSSNLLNWTIPTHLGLLTALDFIDLSDNSISGTIPTELGQLSDLTNLFLSSNKLTSTIPTELGVLTGLQLVLLGRNGLTGSIPNEVCQVQLTPPEPADDFFPSPTSPLSIVVDCEEVACDCNCTCPDDIVDDFYGHYGDGAE
jgi:Leucine-rich repeat (LRR) protein